MDKLTQIPNNIRRLLAEIFKPNEDATSGSPFTVLRLPIRCSSHSLSFCHANGRFSYLIDTGLRVL
ncbi:MAG: hypothetical protein GY943_19320 [Chloroflexi bacterium]|nr:hypothetical protein [Chloroflexota bacterium]